MTSRAPDRQQQHLAESTVTLPSDSEIYEGNNELSSSPPPSSHSHSPVVLYSPPTVWSLLRGAAINLILPFVNGLMLGFGELIAHEVAFRFGWSGTKVGFLKDRKNRGCIRLSSQIASSIWSFPYYHAFRAEARNFRCLAHDIMHYLS
jgi:hypothetical protein